VIRVLSVLHVVLVTTGAMDSSWAMAKSLAMSQSQITEEQVLYRPRRPDAPAPDLAAYGRARSPSEPAERLRILLPGERNRTSKHVGSHGA
jgi:hypothetical protein